MAYKSVSSVLFLEVLYSGLSLVGRNLMLCKDSGKAINCPDYGRRVKLEQTNSEKDFDRWSGDEENFCKSDSKNFKWWAGQWQPDVSSDLSSHLSVFGSHYWRWNLVLSVWPWNKMPKHAVENANFTKTKKGTNVAIAGQENACLLFGLEGHSSLWIH